MLGRSAPRSRGRRRTPPHGCTSGQPSTTSPYPRAPIRAGTAAPCRRICDARAAAGEEAFWTSLSPAETAGGLVERALRRRVTSPTARRLPGRARSSALWTVELAAGITSRACREPRRRADPLGFPPLRESPETRGASICRGAGHRPGRSSRLDLCLDRGMGASRPANAQAGRNTSRSSGVAANCVCAWEPIPNEVR